jgi:adenylate cyclase
VNADIFDVPLRILDGCFEGGVPATLCTASASGIPNISFLSLVRRVDDEHVALSFQYFRKTKQNLEENPRARLLVIDPATAIEYRLRLQFVRTETEGDTFDQLAAGLAAIASQTGMEGSFKLRGADIYRVTECRRFDNGVTASLSAPSADCISALARCSAALAGCPDLETLLGRTLAELDEGLGYPHAFVMAADEAERILFSIASRGYSPSGVGAELRIGDGLIGMAAERRVPVCVANMSRERILAETVRSQGRDDGSPPHAIVLPGLRRTESQLVHPLLAEGRLLGVLVLQSSKPAAFGRVDRELTSVIAHQLASSMARFAELAASDERGETASKGRTGEGPDLCIRHYAEDDSVFVDNEYLIKGVAGRILWLLLRAHEDDERRSFSNRELRLDPRLGLPPLHDNLETRLIMLRRRLEERCPHVAMRRTGRGLFELEVSRKLRLESA